MLGLAAVGAVSSIASQLMKKKAKYSIAPVKKYSSEWRGRRGALDLLNENRNQDEGAARDLNSMNPELYKLAGFEGEFGPTAQNSARLTAAQGRIDRRTAAGKGTKKARARLAKEQDSVAQQAQSLKPGTLKNVGLGDENDRAIDKALGERVRAAAETGQSNDPRLNRELNEQTALLERGIGDRGLTGSSLGTTAMASDSQRRSESLADFARKDITEFNPLRLQQRETLADIAGKRMNLALTPMKARLGVGAAMGETAGKYQNFSQMYQSEREEVARGKLQASIANAQNPGGAAGALGSFGQAAGIVSSAGGTGGFGAMGTRISDFFGGDSTGAKAWARDRSY